MKYDAPFVFAEVNADVIHWITYGDGRRQKVTTGVSPGYSKVSGGNMLDFILTDQGGPGERGEEHQHQKCV